MNNPGKVLKVVSIIMIIFAAIAAALALISLLAIGSVTSQVDAAFVGLIVMVSMIITLISCAFQLWAGIVGLRAGNGNGSVKSAYVFGIILLVLADINVVSAFVSSEFGVSTVVGLILPVLYFLSANQLKKDSEAAPFSNPVDQNFQ